MPDLHLQVLSLTQTLESTPDGVAQHVQELLFYPEMLSFGNKPDALSIQARKLAREVIDREPLDGVHRRQAPKDYAMDSLTLTIEPPAGHSARWPEPLSMILPMLVWDHGEEAIVAYLPALRIEVVSATREELDVQVQDQALFALKRRALDRNLFELALVARSEKLEAERLPWNARAKSPVARYEALYGDEEQEKSVLREVATEMESGKIAQVAYERESEVVKLSQWLTGKRAASVLLVGPTGGGKTAVVHELVRRRHDLGLEKRRIWRTSGSRLVAGQSGYGMWQERCQKLYEEVKEREAILYVGSLSELANVGMSVEQNESIASFLRPMMMRGDLLVVAEATEAEHTAIETHAPKLLDPFRVLRIEGPDRVTSHRILERVHDDQVRKKQRPLTENAIERLERLHQRYAMYSAFPGRPLRFLKQLQSVQDSEEALDTRDVIKAFSKETGLPAWLLDEAQPFDHAAILTWFRERVMAQERAVGAVVQMLATIKAHLARPGKPLASFLFIGPTGVGKTELAKALAEFLYQSRERVVRFDMSEYSHAGAAGRLVSDSFHEGEGLLTAAVRDQPFSVILLDEFEKAAPEVYDLFLQVLGEGRLTDAAGRLAHFTNAVIILTSNLGAQTYAQGTLGFGTSDPASRAEAHFLEAVQAAVRPEFFNRIDAIIPFAPLSRDSVEVIAQRELTLCHERSGLKDLALTFSLEEDLLASLLEQGYDARYGARPMKRQIERQILLPMAEYLNAKPSRRGHLQLGLNGDGQTDVTFTPAQRSRSQSEQERRHQRDQLDWIAQWRRQLKRLLDCSMTVELENEVYRLRKRQAQLQRRLAKRLGRAVHEPMLDEEEQNRLKHLVSLLGRLKKQWRSWQGLEEKALLAYHHEAKALGAEETAMVKEQTFNQLLVEIYAAFTNLGETLCLQLRADHEDWLWMCFRAYVNAIKRWKADLTVGYFVSNPDKEHRVVIDDEVQAIPELILGVTSIEEWLRSSPQKVRALLLMVNGSEAVLRLRGESGVHLRDLPPATKCRCEVKLLEDPANAVRLSLESLQRAPDLKAGVIRRHWDEVRHVYRDAHAEEKGQGDFSPEVLETLMDHYVLKEARQALV